MPYSATDPKTWNRHECISGRQQPPPGGFTKLAERVVPGDAIWDDALQIWRAVLEARTHTDGLTTLAFEDGGRLGAVPASKRFNVSETGMRGWTNPIAASVAWQRGKDAR